MNLPFYAQVIIRCLAALLIGSAIGSERAHHGRSAGMRTHVIVCLGSALTALMSIYAVKYAGYTGDIFRVSAQVISGIGFLGAGMIILKDNNMITGLTTAAGIWTTGIIGLAIGYGFYLGGLLVTALFLICILLFSRFEKHKKDFCNIYIEIDDMYATNRILKEFTQSIPQGFSYRIAPPKSLCQGHLGLYLSMESSLKGELDQFLSVEGVIFAESES